MSNSGAKRLRISQKEKGPVESQEQDGWMMLKMMWVLEAGENS
jgi:hypothetical protein